MILFIALGFAAAHFWAVENGPLWGLGAGIPIALLVPARKAEQDS